MLEYHIRFAHVSKCAFYMFPTMEARVRHFMQGLSPLAINKASIGVLNSDMNYTKMVAFSQATKTRKLKNRMERQGSNKAYSMENFNSTSGSSGGRSAFGGGPSWQSQSFA